MKITQKEKKYKIDQPVYYINHSKEIISCKVYRLDGNGRIWIKEGSGRIIMSHVNDLINLDEILVCSYCGSTDVEDTRMVNVNSKEVRNLSDPYHIYCNNCQKDIGESELIKGSAYFSNPTMTCTKCGWKGKSDKLQLCYFKGEEQSECLACPTCKTDYFLKEL